MVERSKQLLTEVITKKVYTINLLASINYIVNFMVAKSLREMQKMELEKQRIAEKGISNLFIFEIRGNREEAKLSYGKIVEKLKINLKGGENSIEIMFYNEDFGRP